jgi:HEAT repeat protein
VWKWLRKSASVRRDSAHDVLKPVELVAWPTGENIQLPPSEAQKDAANRLDSAIKARDADQVREGVTRAYAAGLHPIHSPLLISLADASWHSCHEDAVFGLQCLKDPSAIAVLEKVAFSVHEYLDYDENFGLARKCTWALADIGTPDAHSALTRLAGCDNAMIAGYAKKRLDNWLAESHRKGF